MSSSEDSSSEEESILNNLSKCVFFLFFIHVANSSAKILCDC